MDDGERSASAACALEIAQRRRPRLVQKTQGNGRTDDWHNQGTARDAAVPTPRQSATAVAWVLAAVPYNLIRYRNLRHQA